MPFRRHAHPTEQDAAWFLFVVIDYGVLSDCRAVINVRIALFICRSASLAAVSGALSAGAGWLAANCSTVERPLPVASFGHGADFDTAGNGPRNYRSVSLIRRAAVKLSNYRI